jgi:hypothetical protein
MKLMTKAIEKAARKQYDKGWDFKTQKVVAKFFDPSGPYTWYLINQDPDDTDYLWGFVKGHEVEQGSFSLFDLTEHKGPLGLGIERDKFFKPMPATEVWQALLDGKHI